MTTEPLFKSAASALAFALNYSSLSYQRPLMNRLAAGSAPTGKGLGGLDGAAQSGMIRAELVALGQVSEAILIARMSPRSQPCSCNASCCSGGKPNPEWQQAVRYLVNHLRVAMQLCPNYHDLRSACVLKYFGTNEPLVQIARSCEVNKDTASNHYSKISKALKTLERLAWSEFDERMLATGIIERETEKSSC